MNSQLSQLQISDPVIPGIAAKTILSLDSSIRADYPRLTDWPVPLASASHLGGGAASSQITLFPVC